MAVETGLEGKPWHISAAVALAIACLIAGGVYWFKIKDMRLAYERKQATLTSLQQKITEGRAAKARLPQFEEEVARLTLELDKLLLILPPRRNTEDLLRRVRTLTERGDFDLLRFQPQAIRVNDFYSEWPIKIELEGTYHNLAMFFDRIGRFSRIINIDVLNISAINSPRAPHHTIKAAFTAKTFLYNEPPEADDPGTVGGSP